MSFAETHEDTSVQIDVPQGGPIARISEPLDRKATGDIPVSDKVGGLAFQEFRDAIEFAKLMSQGGDDNTTIPPHLRGKPYSCLAIVTRAMWWRMDPYFVAEHSMEVEQGWPKVKRLGFTSAIFQAVVNSRAPIKHRLRHRFDGEGENMTCTVWTTFIGEDAPAEHTSPPLKDLHPGHTEKGFVKGSPLWDDKPRVQMVYNTIRDWARLYCQDIMGGIYTIEEIQAIRNETLGADAPTPASPNLLARLPGRTADAEGFQDNVVTQAISKPKARRKAKDSARTSADGGPSAELSKQREPDTSPAASPGAFTPSQPLSSEARPEGTENAAGDTTPKAPATADEYVKRWTDMIEAATNPDDLEARWDGDRELRDTLSVKVKDRNSLQKILVAKASELRAAEVRKR